MPEWNEEELKFAGKMQSQFEPELITRTVEQFEETGITPGQTKLCDFVVPYSDRIEGGRGSTDVGDVSWVVPTAQFTTACYALGIRTQASNFVFRDEHRPQGNAVCRQDSRHNRLPVHDLRGA